MGGGALSIVLDRVKKAENHCFKVRNTPIYSFAGLLINFEWCNKNVPLGNHY